MTTTTDNLANVALPAGAVDATDWYDVDTADAARFFTGTSRIVEREHRDIEINIEGTHYQDGTLRREIVLVDGECDYLPGPNRTELLTLTIGDARQLGEALIAAADELTRLTD